jgi:uncharacterized protein YndB with AHSA1/START domain
MPDQQQNSNPIDAVRCTITVPAPPERAFLAFVRGFGEWWPQEYTWSGGVLESIGIEPGEGGRCYERGPHGFRCDWGRVLVWLPPRRLVFSWQISPTRAPEPNPARASQVEVRFAETEGGAKVELEHRHFDRHGEGSAKYRDAMASPQGWPHLLDRYAGIL